MFTACIHPPALTEALHPRTHSPIAADRLLNYALACLRATRLQPELQREVIGHAEDLCEDKSVSACVSE